MIYLICFYSPPILNLLPLLNFPFLPFNWFSNPIVIKSPSYFLHTKKIPYHPIIKVCPWIKDLRVGFYECIMIGFLKRHNRFYINWIFFIAVMKISCEYFLKKNLMPCIFSCLNEKLNHKFWNILSSNYFQCWKVYL